MNGVGFRHAAGTVDAEREATAPVRWPARPGGAGGDLRGPAYWRPASFIMRSSQRVASAQVAPSPLL